MIEPTAKLTLPVPRREPMMILDMGLGSREQGFPSHKPATPLPPLPSKPL